MAIMVCGLPPKRCCEGSIVFLYDYMYMAWKQRLGYYNIIFPFEDTLTCAQREEYMLNLSRECIWIFSLTLSNGLFLVTNNMHVPCSMLFDSLVSVP